MRQEPADASEMISQLLFGSHYMVLEERTKWVRVRMAFDRYEGWIDRKQHYSIDESTFKTLEAASPLHVSSELVSLVADESGNYTPILVGSTLPNLQDGELLELGGRNWKWEGSSLALQKPDKSRMIEFAYLFLNAPYQWGGRSLFGIDCSGYTQLIYKMSGYKLPRDAYQQAELGQTLSFVEEAMPGDLAFFDNAEGRIIHVGILLEDNYIIHASGKVRVDRIDHQGIYNPEIRGYTHKLRLIKRID